MEEIEIGISGQPLDDVFARSSNKISEEPVPPDSLTKLLSSIQEDLINDILKQSEAPTEDWEWSNLTELCCFSVHPSISGKGIQKHYIRPFESYQGSSVFSCVRTTGTEVARDRTVNATHPRKKRRTIIQLPKPKQLLRPRVRWTGAGAGTRIFSNSVRPRNRVPALISQWVGDTLWSYWPNTLENMKKWGCSRAKTLEWSTTNLSGLQVVILTPGDEIILPLGCYCLVISLTPTIMTEMEYIDSESLFQSLLHQLREKYISQDQSDQEDYVTKYFYKVFKEAFGREWEDVERNVEKAWEKEVEQEGLKEEKEKERQAERERESG